MNRAINQLTTYTILAAVFFMSAAPVFAASFEFSPASGNLVSGCTYNLIVYADASSQSSNAADLVVNYNPAQLEVLDSIGTESGIQVQPGSAYQAYVGNIVNQTNGKITVTAFSVGGNLVNRRPFITIKAKPLTTGTISLQISYTTQGNTLDSNIADSATSLDILTSVTNASFNIINGNCEQDSAAPVVVFTSPTQNETGFSNNVVTLEISDGGSGVQLSSVQIVINNVSYNTNSPEVSYQSVGSGYSFTITLSEDIDGTAPGTITVTASDLNGNQVNATNNFNQSGEVTQPGECVASNNFFITGNPEYIFKDTFLENTVIHQIVTSSVTSSGSAFTVALLLGLILLTVSLLRLLIAFPNPLLIVLAIANITGRKHRIIWGAVFDDTTKIVLPFATCRLYLKGTNDLVAQTVSDAKGWYGFDVDAGEYALEVSKNGYLQVAHNLVVRSKDEAVNAKVYLTAKKLNDEDQSKIVLFFRFTKYLFVLLLETLTPYVLLLGLFVASVGITQKQNLWNVLLMLAYIVVIICAVRYKSVRLQIDSRVVDRNNYRIPNLQINIHELHSGRLLDTVWTDTRGSFDFFGKPGEYGLFLFSSMYQFQPGNQEFRKTAKLNLLSAKLQPADNRLKLYAARIAENNLSSNNSNYLNPFVD